VLLFEYLTIFGEKNYEYFPLKKVLLLIWRTLHATLGGSNLQLRMINFTRKQNNLPPLRTDIYTKSTEDDVEKFEQEVASNFFGMNPYFNEAEASASESLMDSLLATLPKPILEGYTTLKKNNYTPLSKVQLRAFELEVQDKASHGGIKFKPQSEINPEEAEEDGSSSDSNSQSRQIKTETEMLTLRIAHMNFLYV